MKKYLFYAFGISLFLATVSCADDDNAFVASSPSEISNTVTSGTWKISSFTEDNVHGEAAFSGYTFTFSTSNTVNAVNGANNYSGTWTVGNESGDDDNTSNDLHFILNFSSPDSFTELSEDWDIIERTSTKLRLKHVSGGDGSTDFLTFNKQ